MPSQVHDPALISAIVEQVLIALQRVKINDTTAEESRNDAADFESLPDGGFIDIGPDLKSTSCAKLAPAHEADPAPASLTSEAAPPAAESPVFPIATHSSGDTWYMISAGHAVGVFCGWHIVRPLVVGVSGACFKKYPSEPAAAAAFAEARAAGVVTMIPK